MNQNRPMTLIESPFSAPDERELVRNVYYAMLVAHDSLERGEAPYASHLFFTQMLDDNDAHERELGINAGLDIGKLAVRSAIYLDLGVSRGMEYGIESAKNARRAIEERRLFEEGLSQDEVGERIFALAKERKLPEYEAVLAIYGRILKGETT